MYQASDNAGASIGEHQWHRMKQQLGSLYRNAKEISVKPSDPEYAKVAAMRPLTQLNEIESVINHYCDLFDKYQEDDEDLFI